MKTYLDCIPCFIRQALDAVMLVTSNETIHESVIREVLDAVSRMDLKKSPPEMGQHIHRTIRNFSGSRDPYKKVKDRFNTYALKLYPALNEIIEKSSNKLDTATRLAIAGNVIDFGANNDVDQAVVDKTIELSLSSQIVGNMEHFLKALGSAENILYIGDNAGEIVFDQLLIKQLPADRITFAVRGKPVINDATIDDAVATGITELVEVIDNGSDAPGTVLEECSGKFRRFFQDADLIIAKGQGNFETLSGVDKKIFFLLKAKCPVIARHIGCDVGGFVVSS